MTSLTSTEVVRKIASENNLTISREAVHLLADYFSFRKYKKGERILDEGDICNQLLYLEKGMTRQFYFKNGKDLTEHIGYEGGVIVCLESYFREEPTKLIIEALEPVFGWVIKKEDIVVLADGNAEIGTFYRKIFESSLIDSQVKADTLRFASAHERYLKLLELHPEILKRAPLVNIASLLQMTPETLSRVRSAVLNDKKGNE